MSARVFPEWRIGNPLHVEKEVERTGLLLSPMNWRIISSRTILHIIPFMCMSAT